MLGEIQYTLNDLFAQLGLENSDEAIEVFIQTHTMSRSQNIKNAPFWNERQRAFIAEEWRHDAVWAEVIEELNARLCVTND